MYLATALVQFDVSINNIFYLHFASCSLVVFGTLTKVKTILDCLGFIVSQRPPVFVNIMHKSYMEELSIS